MNNQEKFTTRSSKLKVHSRFAKDVIVSRPSGAGGRGGAGAEGASVLPAKFSVDVPFFLICSLNVLILKEVTKNVHENRQIKSRAG